MAFFNGWPWTQFQEQNLDWLIREMNKIQSSIPQQIRDILTQMGFNPNGQNKDYYNVRDYGAIGDGVADDWSAIQNVLTMAKNSGGGTVFIPAGVFNVSKTLIVGDNTYLVGTGAGSVINCTMVMQFWGTAVAVVGSNCGVLHLKANYYDSQSLPVADSPVNGAIGITNCDYTDAVNQTRGALCPENENIIIEDVYTDGNYLIQCEPVTETRNVIYNDINCPDAMVSMTAGSLYNGVNGEIYNAIINNVSCGFLRTHIGQYGGLTIVNNINAPFAYVSGYNMTINNMNIHPYADSNFARATSGAPTVANLVIVPAGTVRPMKLTNISVLGSDYTNEIGIQVMTGTGYLLTENVSSAGHDHNIVMLTGTMLGSNCVFDQSLGVNNTINGLFAMSKIGTNAGSANSLYQLESGSFSYAGDIIATGGWSDNKIVRNGQMLKMFARVQGTLSNGATLFTTSIHPTMTTQAIAKIHTSADPTTWKDALITWNTDGTVVINNIYTSVANYQVVIIDMTSIG